MTDYDNDTLNERETTHGDYATTARVAQALKTIIDDHLEMSHFTPAQKESIDLICTKIARLVSGNPNTKDTWDDIAGYANLISEKL